MDLYMGDEQYGKAIEIGTETYKKKERGIHKNKIGYLLF